MAIKIDSAAVMRQLTHGTNYEPEPRKFAGQGVTFVHHRFPIKGGISAREAMMRDMARPNAFLSKLRQSQG